MKDDIPDIEPENIPPDAPDALRVMAQVANGLAPDTAIGKAYQASFEGEKTKFAKDLTALWIAYWRGRSGPSAEWDGVGPCPTCRGVGGGSVVDAGSDEAEKLLDELLEGL